jgi:SAM-dependent methyltransferase
MKQTFPSGLRLGEGGTRTTVHDVPGTMGGRVMKGPHNPAEFAERLYAAESLCALAPAASTTVDAEPYSLQWFLNIEDQRHNRGGRWIPRLLEFAKHNGETLLGLGNGLGTDWVQYARHGAAVVVCSSSADQLSLIRRNFELRGLSGRFLHARPTSLPVQSASVDVVCASSFLQETFDRVAAVEEIHRVLRPGGKILAVAPARYDVAFWTNLCFGWLHGWRRPAPGTPPAGRLSARGLRRLFHRFVEHRVHKRQLLQSELPYLWRGWPMPLMQRWMGHVLVMKAFKPLSASLAIKAAA